MLFSLVFLVLLSLEFLFPRVFVSFGCVLCFCFCIFVFLISFGFVDVGC